MTTDAITKKEESLTDRPQPPGSPPRESAPSILREDQPSVARGFAMAGAALVIFGGMALAFNLFGRAVRVSTGWSIFCVTVGLFGMLFHAAFDRDVQLRRLYMLFGFGTLALGVALCLIPYPSAVGDLMRWGVPCLVIALLFLLAFLRNEDDPYFRNLTQKVLGTAGAALALGGLFGGNLRADFFLPMGLVFSLIGLVYVTAYVGSRGVSDDTAYYASVGLAAAGGLVALVALGRSLLTAGGSSYFVSVGVMLLFVGLLYATVGLVMALDRPILVMTRRELGAFFYSPIVYLALLGFSACWWGSYWIFLGQLLDVGPGSQPMLEPIVRNYYFSIVPVMVLLALVPALTMRLLSEEQRSGTMEVLLTAPVDEPAIVLSKFFAALITYLVMWLPSVLFLLAIPLAGGNAFDYRPLLSFAVVILVTGGAFVSMGLFFSSLTKSQIASFVLTFAGMVALMVVFFAGQATRDSAWETVLKHVSFLDLWFSTLEGKIVPRFLLFWASMTVLFLFVTVKVLESRKWR
ncbi:MAG: ABC transporter permease [Gemmataceae bacterium]